jgi:hypothetical protein
MEPEREANEESVVVVLQEKLKAMNWTLILACLNQTDDSDFLSGIAFV